MSLTDPQPLVVPAREVRKAIERAVPYFKFTVRRVSFGDLAGCDRLVVSSDAWGIVQGGQAVYWKVVEAVKPFGAQVLVPW